MILLFISTLKIGIRYKMEIPGKIQFFVQSSRFTVQTYCSIQPIVTKTNGMEMIVAHKQKCGMRQYDVQLKLSFEAAIYLAVRELFILRIRLIIYLISSLPIVILFRIRMNDKIFFLSLEYFWKSC